MRVMAAPLALSLLPLLILLPLSRGGGELTLVEGGRRNVDDAPRARVILPSRRGGHHTQRRHVPSVIFAPVEGKRVITKQLFVNGNSRQSIDDAFKIYDHFVATRGALDHVADPFFVTPPSQRTTMATPTIDHLPSHGKRPSPFSDISFPSTTPSPPRPSTPAVKLIHQNIPGMPHSRGLRREETRFPSETKIIHRPETPLLRGRVVPITVSRPPPRASPPPPREQIDNNRAQSGGLTVLTPQQNQAEVFRAPPAPPPPPPPPPPPQQSPPPSQQLLISQPYTGFPQVVQSPYRDPSFVPDPHNQDEMAWANYLASRNSAQMIRMRRFRPTGGGSFSRNRQPTRPIPLPSDDFMSPEGEGAPQSPFDIDPNRQLPPSAFSIDEPNFERPSNRLRNYFTRYPPNQPQFPPPPHYYQQQGPPFNAFSQPFPDQSSFPPPPRQFNPHHHPQPLYFPDDNTAPPPMARTTMSTPTPSPPVFFPPQHSSFYNGPALPPPMRREIPSSPTLISIPDSPPPSVPSFAPSPPPLHPPPFEHRIQPEPISTVNRPISALAPNQKLDTCCRKQGVSPVCQNICNFDSFDDKTLVGAFLTGQCPGNQLGKAFDCASSKANHNDCCMAGGLGTFLGGKCLPFCHTHRDTPSNVLDYLPCLQVFRVIRDCYRDYQVHNPNIFGD